MISQTLIGETFSLLDEAFEREIPPSKRVLIISAGNQGKLSVYRRFQRQGIKMVVIDHADHWAKACVETGLFEGFIPLNLDRRESLFDEIIEAVIDSGLLFNEVISFCEAAAPLAARIAYAMGLVDDFGGK